MIKNYEVEHITPSFDSQLLKVVFRLCTKHQVEKVVLSCDGERYMIIKKKYVKRGDLKFKRGDLKFEMNCFTSSTIIEVD